MLSRLLAAACVLTVLAAPALPDRPPIKQLPPIPDKQLPLPPGTTRLNLYIGGAIFPPNYFVTLEGDTLTYKVRDYVDQKPVETVQTIKPTPEAWREFWKSMDEVGLWNWKPVYEDTTLADGTHWSVEAVHEGRGVRSRGRIFYPGQETREKPGESDKDRGPIFEKYLAAVRKLIGDRQFR